MKVSGSRTSAMDLALKNLVTVIHTKGTTFRGESMAKANIFGDLANSMTVSGKMDSNKDLDCGKGWKVISMLANG